MRLDGHAPARARTFMTRYMFLFLSLLIGLILQLFDYSPILPPFPPKFETADCHYVRLTSLTDMGGFVELTVSHVGSFEYPPEYLPNFVSLELSTGPATFNYTGEHAVAFSRSDDSMTIRYSHPFSGASSATIRCASKFLGRAAYELRDSPSADGNSSYQSGAAPHFHRVCLEHDKVMFFAYPSRVHAGVPFGLKRIPVEFLDMTMKSYFDRHKVQLQPNPAVLISVLPTAPLQLVLFALPDLFDLIGSHPTVQRYNFLSMGEPGLATGAVLSLMGAKAAENRSAVACFRELFVPSVQPERALAQEEVQDALGRNFGDVRKWLRKAVSANRKRIVVSPGLRHRLEDRIVEFCKDCEVSVVDMAHFDGWPSKLADAGFLIATQLETLVPLLFMNQGSIVIDATPEKCLCEAGREFAERHGVGYITIRSAARCDCASASTDFNALDDADIESILTILKSEIFTKTIASRETL
jgi:hypothetical protein